jgi:hypothetical protein
MWPSVPQQVEPKPSANRETTLYGPVSPEFSLDPDVRYWPLADIPEQAINVRFRTIADEVGYWPGTVCPLMTQSGHQALRGNTKSRVGCGNSIAILRQRYIVAQ